MKLYEFLRICDNKESLVDYLSEKGVIGKSMKCPKCESRIELDVRNMRMKCPSNIYKTVAKKKRQKIRCTFETGPFKGTWFERINLQLDTVCRFIAYFVWVPPPHVKRLMSELSLTKKTVVDWCSFCREVCQFWLSSCPPQIGGENCVVEVYEAKIGKRKHHKGRIISGQWVFGGIDRESKQVFIEPIDARDASTLLGVIQRHIRPGTIIHSDCWRAYNCLEHQGFQHLSVKHKMNFVDPETGVHTQNIERLWRDMRGAIPRFGHRKAHYDFYLAEFLFKRQFEYRERIDAFFNTMSRMYPLAHNE